MFDKLFPYRLKSVVPPGGEGEDERVRIRFNMLGPHSIVINGREIYEQDCLRSEQRAWVALLYLVLHRRPVDQARMVGEAWPDEPENASCDTLRQAVFRLHSELSDENTVQIFELRDGLIRFSDKVRVTTDAGEMEELFNKTKGMPDNVEKLEMLMRAAALYRGRLLIQGQADAADWLMPYTVYYDQVFLNITVELLKMFGVLFCR